MLGIKYVKAVFSVDYLATTRRAAADCWLLELYATTLLLLGFIYLILICLILFILVYIDNVTVIIVIARRIFLVR